MTFTVKQLADLLNVSKGTITNYSNQLKLELNKNNHGVIIISLEQCIDIAETINKNRTAINKVNVEQLYKIKEKSEIKKQFSKDETIVNNTEESKFIELLQEQIKSLKQDKGDYKEQLNVKDRQIEQLNNTLNEQQRLLSQQQSLQLQSNEKIKLLEFELKEVKEDVREATDTTDIHHSIFSEEDRDDKNEQKLYNELKQDKKNESFISRLFKRL